MSNTSTPVPSSSAEYDPATISFIRRTLAPDSSPSIPLEKLLPALTSEAEVDVELYAIISIVYREFIFPWYHAITTSPHFPTELNLLLAHISLTLESHLRQLDLFSFLFTFLPTLLNSEIQAARHRASLNTLERRLDSELRVHPADDLQIVEEYREDKATEEYWRVVCADLVEVLIPSEERECKIAGTMAREILVKTLCIVTEVCGKEYIWVEGLTKLLKDEGSDGGGSDVNVTVSKMSSWADKIISGIEWTYRSVRFLGGTLYTAYIQPLTESPQQTKRRLARQQQDPDLLLTTPLFTLISTLLNLPSTRPWLPAFIDLLSTPLQSPSPFSTALDTHLRHLLLQPLTTPSSLAKLLRTARCALFPENRLPPPRKEPDEKEMMKLRRELWKAWDGRFGKVVGGKEAFGWIQFAERGRLVRRAVEGLIAGMLPELAVGSEEE